MRHLTKYLGSSTMFRVFNRVARQVLKYPSIRTHSVFKFTVPTPVDEDPDKSIILETMISDFMLGSGRVPVGFIDDELKTLLIAFRKHNDGNKRAMDSQMERDTVAFIEFLSVVSLEDTQRYGDLLAYHAIGSLNNKFLILKLLQKKSDFIDFNEIKQTIDQIGFSSIQSIFRNKIHEVIHYRTHYKSDFFSDRRIGFLIESSELVNNAGNLADLIDIYEKCKVLSSVFAKEDVYLFEFLLFGKMNEEIHQGLKEVIFKNYTSLDSSRTRCYQNKTESEKKEIISEDEARLDMVIPQAPLYTKEGIVKQDGIPIKGKLDIQRGLFYRGMSLEELVKEKVEINIEAISNIDFKIIDTRIEHTFPWQHCFPMRTKIVLPKVYEAEIRAKLKEYADIAKIDNEPTGHESIWSCSPSHNVPKV